MAAIDKYNPCLSWREQLFVLLSGFVCRSWIDNLVNNPQGVIQDQLCNNIKFSHPRTCSAFH